VDVPLEALKLGRGLQQFKIAAITMVKNEQDVIEPFVRHNLQLVDYMVVLDNGSVDETRNILMQLAKEFPQLAVLHDGSFGYTQAERMTRLLHRAQKTFPADFVFLLDADEFVDCSDRDSLHAILNTIPSGGIGVMPWCSFVLKPGCHPAPDGNSDPLRAMVWRRRMEVSQEYKAIVRLDRQSADWVKVLLGNHWVRTVADLNLPALRLPELRLLHFPVRSREQFAAKCVVGWMAYLDKDPLAERRQFGFQWRDNFKLLIEGHPFDDQLLGQASFLYSASPRPIDWDTDVVKETPQLNYERRYSTGLSMDTLQLVSRSWRQAIIGNPDRVVAKLLNEGKQKEALVYLEDAIAQEESAVLWNDWAMLHHRGGDLKRAESGFRRALMLDETDRMASVNLGLLLFSQGRLKEGWPFLKPYKDTLNEKEAALLHSFSERMRKQLGLQPKQETQLSGASSAMNKTSTSAPECVLPSALPASTQGKGKNLGVVLQVVDPPVILNEDHFRPVTDMQRAMELFKASIRFVEVEIHSYCNRNCSFCGNSFLDRRSNKTLMNPATYSKIIDDLSKIDYEGVVWYSRYNEPCADRPLFIERLREARAKLPHAHLQTFTNGDYITAEYIEALRDAGLNRLSIMAYLGKDEKPTQENFLNAMMTRLEKLGVAWKFETPSCARIEIPGIDVTYNYTDFLRFGTNRGGALATGSIIKRLSPCTVPITDVYIDYNGSMVPCCDIRSDYSLHKDFVVYKLTPENSIFEGYANSKLVAWRRTLSRFGKKQFPCDTCSRRTYTGTPPVASMFNIIESKIGPA